MTETEPRYANVYLVNGFGHFQGDWNDRAEADRLAWYNKDKLLYRIKCVERLTND